MLLAAANLEAGRFNNVFLHDESLIYCRNVLV